MEKKIFLAAPFKALVNNKSNAMQDSDRKRIEDLISFFDFKPCLSKKFPALSGGQKQRIASARAIITNPKLVLADEPTRSIRFKIG